MRLQTKREYVPVLQMFAVGYFQSDLQNAENLLM
jgi:hypothetical protein